MGSLFTIIELGVVASWRNDWSGFSGGYINRVNFISFTTVWTLIGLVVHWALPLIGVAIWVSILLVVVRRPHRCLFV